MRLKIEQLDDYDDVDITIRCSAVDGEDKTQLTGRTEDVDMSKIQEKIQEGKSEPLL